MWTVPISWYRVINGRRGWVKSVTGLNVSQSVDTLSDIVKLLTWARLSDKTDVNAMHVEWYITAALISVRRSRLSLQCWPLASHFEPIPRCRNVRRRSKHEPPTLTRLPACLSACVPVTDRCIRQFKAMSAMIAGQTDSVTSARCISASRAAAAATAHWRNEVKLIGYWSRNQIWHSHRELFTWGEMFAIYEYFSAS